MMRRRSLFFCVTILVLSVAALYLYKTESTRAPKYLLAKASLMDLEDAVLANGVLAPIEIVSIGAQVNGQVKSIMVALGDKVTAGQLLARIDPVLQVNALKKAEATLASAHARKQAKVLQLKNYNTILKRQRQLFNDEVNSLADVEQAELNVQIANTDMRVLNSEILQTKIEVDIAKASYEYTNITAPMDGEIMSIIAQTGQTLVSAQASPTILIMGKNDRMTVKAKISEADISRVHTGQEVYFSTVGQPTVTYRGKLSAIEGVPDSEAQLKGGGGAVSATPVYYNGIFDVANSDGALKAGMNVQIHIVRHVAENTLVIPVTALIGKLPQAQHYQVKLLSGGKAVTRSVWIGMISGPYAQVLGGISLGETVIVRTDAAPS